MKHNKNSIFIYNKKILILSVNKLYKLMRMMENQHQNQLLQVKKKKRMMEKLLEFKILYFQEEIIHNADDAHGHKMDIETEQK